jgi:DNA-binding beta-propeller fold protein YncE
MAAFRLTGGDRSLRRRGRTGAGLAAALFVLSGCSVVANPRPAVVHDPSLAPGGPVGYVVCTDAVTPVELDTRTAEADIPLGLSGTPALGNFAVTTSGDGRWAYVVTSNGVVSTSATSSTGPAPQPTGATTSTIAGTPAQPAGVGVQNVVVPIDLVSQEARRPIKIPGQGGTHAIVVLPGGRTVLAASGSTIVPVDAATRRVGAPLDLGPGHTIFGMALDPKGTTLYALVAGGVFPVTIANGTAGAEIPTGLSASSVYSPHGIAVTGDGATVYVVGQAGVGQGGVDFGGRVLPIVASTRATLPKTGFDRFGIADPAALAITADGSSLLVVDSANNWVNPVPLSTFSTPPAPVPLPQPSGSASTSGTQHPTDIVLGPGRSGAFIVVGFNTVRPYEPGSQTFGRPIPVCSGAASMAVAPAP